MWREYLPKASLFAIDNDPATLSYVQDVRDCCPYLLDQGSPEALRDFVKKSGGQFDVIIDDGGHHMHQQITSFNELFPHVVRGGMYVLEDYTTSYWTWFGGKPLNDPSTSVGMLKWLIDCVNKPMIGEDEETENWIGNRVSVSKLERSSLHSDVEELHVFNSIAFVVKSENLSLEPCPYLPQ